MKICRTIALDFDGVLHDFAGDASAALGPPVSGSQQAVATLQAAQCQVVVCTARNALQVAHWLGRHGFPPLPVTASKPNAWASVDARAHRFDGAWEADFVHMVLRAGPHWTQQT